MNFKCLQKYMAFSTNNPNGCFYGYFWVTEHGKQCGRRIAFEVGQGLGLV